MTSKIRHEQEPRVTFDRPVRILADGAQVPLVGRALNLSRSGLFVTASKLFSRGARLDVAFDLPTGESSWTIRARACVMRQIGPVSGQEPAGMALRFERLEQVGAAAAIARFVATQSGAAHYTGTH